MTSKFWVGGSGTWNSSSTTNWSLSSGGASGAAAPTTSDNVFFDANSGGGTVTVNAASCLNITCTGFTGNITGNSFINVAGSVVLSPTMQLSLNSGVGAMSLEPTSAITITTAGANLTSFTGYQLSTAQTVTLQDDLVMGAGSSFQVGGITGAELNTNGHALTCSTVTIGGNAVLACGSSTFTINSSLSFNGSVANFQAGTSTFIFPNGNPPTALPYYNLNFTNVSSSSASGLSITGNLQITTGNPGFTLTLDYTVTGNVTINGIASPDTTITFDAGCTSGGLLTIAGNSPTNRIFVNTSTFGTAETLTCVGANLSNCNFQDITLSNSGSFTGASLGNCGRNTGITFQSPVNYYWIHPGGTVNYFTNNWATSSGGTPGTGFPCPGIDTAFFDANSFSTTGEEIVVSNLGNGAFASMDWTGVTNNPTFGFNNTSQFYGAIYKFNSGMAMSGVNQVSIRGDQTVTMQTGGATFTAGLSMQGINGTLMFGPNFLSTAALSQEYGTINRGTGSIQFTNFTTLTGTKTHIENSAIATFTGPTFSINAATGVTWTPGNGLTIFTSSTAGVKSFTGAGLSFGKIYDHTTGAGTLNFVGAANFLGIQADPGRTIKFTAATTYIVGALPRGSASGNVTITSITAAQHILTSSGSIISCDYLTLSQSDATQTNTFYAGTHSTNSGSNTNWLFQAAPGPAHLQSFNGIAEASIATINGVALSSITNVNGI